MTPWTAACRAPQSFTIAQIHIPHYYSNSCPLSWWCYPTISSSVTCFSSCPQSFPASGSFPMSRLFASGSQSIGASASASALPMNIQAWFPLGWTGLISLLSKGLSRVFSNTKFESINSLALSLVYGRTLTSVHNCFMYSPPVFSKELNWTMNILFFSGLWEYLRDLMACIFRIFAPVSFSYSKAII